MSSNDAQYNVANLTEEKFIKAYVEYAKEIQKVYGKHIMKIIRWFGKGVQKIPTR